MRGLGHKHWDSELQGRKKNVNMQWNFIKDTVQEVT